MVTSKVDRRVGRRAWNTGLTSETDARLSEVSRKIAALHAAGTYDKVNDYKRGRPGKRHSVETREKISTAGRNNKYQRVCKRSHQFTDVKGRTFTFDSTWEDALARRLDQLGVDWVRPDPITYILYGVMRHYYADFFLPQYDLYLDPKNQYCKQVQQPKLDAVSKLINLEIIETLEQCKNWSLRQDSNLE